MSIVKPGIMYYIILIIILLNILDALGKNEQYHFLCFFLLSLEKKEEKNKIKEMIGCKERSMLVLSVLQLNKRVGNVQSIFSIDKAIYELFERGKGQCN